MDLIKTLGSLITEAKTLPKGGDYFAFAIHVLQFAVDLLTQIHPTKPVVGDAPGTADLLASVDAAEPLSEIEIQAITAEPPLVGGPITDVLLIVRVLATVKKYAPEVWSIVQTLLHKAHA